MHLRMMSGRIKLGVCGGMCKPKRGVSGHMVCEHRCVPVNVHAHVCVCVHVCFV